MGFGGHSAPQNGSAGYRIGKFDWEWASLMGAVHLLREREKEVGRDLFLKHQEGSKIWECRCAIQQMLYVTRAVPRVKIG